MIYHSCFKDLAALPSVLAIALVQSGCLCLRHCERSHEKRPRLCFVLGREAPRKEKTDGRGTEVTEVTGADSSKAVQTQVDRVEKRGKQGR